MVLRFSNRRSCLRNFEGVCAVIENAVRERCRLTVMTIGFFFTIAYYTPPLPEGKI